MMGGGAGMMANILQVSSRLSTVEVRGEVIRLPEQLLSCLKPDFKNVHTNVNTLMYTRIQWDEGKNRSNLHKHGIGFSSAVELFNYPHLVLLDTRENYGEERWIGVGWIGAMIGVVVFTLSENEDSETNIIRILSARKASKKEVTLFEQEIKN
jgi:hypothetical protein